MNSLVRGPMSCVDDRLVATVGVTSMDDGGPRPQQSAYVSDGAMRLTQPLCDRCFIGVDASCGANHLRLVEHNLVEHRLRHALGMLDELSDLFFDNIRTVSAEGRSQPIAESRTAPPT